MKVFINLMLVNVALAFTATAATPSFEWNGTSGTVTCATNGDGNSTWRGDIQNWLKNDNSGLDSAFVMQMQDWAANHNFDLSSINPDDVRTWLQNHPLFQSDGSCLTDVENWLQSHHDGNFGEGGSGGCDFGSHSGDGNKGDDFEEEHSPQAVPEPGSIASLISGAILLGGCLLRRRK